jgi:ribonuclease P protein component
MSLTFPKSEKLTSRLVMDEIFSTGKELKKFPYLLKYVKETAVETGEVKIVISVPKRKAKLAVDRNRLRRQIREAYRLNKKELLEFCLVNKIKLALFLIYTGKEKEQYQRIEAKLKLTLYELQEKLK